MFEIINTFGVWAQAADTRAGMVAAALGTIGFGVTGQSEALRASVRTPTPVGLSLLITTLALCVASGVFVILVLTPRLRADPQLNRASFVSVAQHCLASLSQQKRSDMYRELCEQAWILACIARRKYGLLRYAVLLAAAAALALLGWTVESALHPP